MSQVPIHIIGKLTERTRNLFKKGNANGVSYLYKKDELRSDNTLVFRFKDLKD